MIQFECRNLRPSREAIQTLRRLSGSNVYGAERFRLVWGWDVRDFTGENLFFRYDVPERWLERFHLEYWAPPGSFGTPETWIYNGYDKSIGPYPRGGGYERFMTFEHARTHEFIYPTPLLVTEALGLARRAMLRPSSEEIATSIMEDKRLKAEAVRTQRHDIVDNNISAFGLSPWMPVSGPMTPTTRRTDWRKAL